MSLTPNCAFGASIHASSGEASSVSFLPAGNATSLEHSRLQAASSGELGRLPSNTCTAPDALLTTPVNNSGNSSAGNFSTARGILHLPLSVDGSLQPGKSNHPGQSGAGSPEATSSKIPQPSAPCGACKFLRRKCTTTCIFAAHFHPDQSSRFANVHKIFGASNVAKWLQDLPPQSRDDAVKSLCYEADARIKDPVYGCVGALFALQQQVMRLQAESTAAQAELARLRALAAGQASSMTFPPSDLPPTRLPASGQMNGIPPFVTATLPSPTAAMLMGTFGGYNSSVLPTGAPIYDPQLKAGGTLGAELLANNLPTQLYPMSAVAQSVSTPSFGPQALGTPPSLKSSPQGMPSEQLLLHGLRAWPSSSSSSELGVKASLLESPLQGHTQAVPNVSGSTKRLKSEQGSSTSLLEMPSSVCSRLRQGFDTVAGQLECSRQTLMQSELDPAHFLLLQQLPQSSTASLNGVRQ